MESKQGYQTREVVDSRFEIVNGGKNQLTVEDATAFLLWAVDGDKIKAMLHGEINEQVFYAMLRTFGKDFPDMVRQAVVRYIAGCLFPPKEPESLTAEVEGSIDDLLAKVHSLKEGDGECKV